MEASFWINFLTEFRPHTICAWTRPMKIEWFKLLSRRGVYVAETRTRPMVECIIDLLYRSEHVGTAKGDADHTGVENASDNDSNTN